MRRSVRLAAAAIGVTLMMLPALLPSAEPTWYTAGFALHQAYAEATLSGEPGATEAPVPRPLTERFSWLLPAAVALATGVIGIFIVSLVQEVHRRLPPPVPPA